MNKRCTISSPRCIHISYLLFGRHIYKVTMCRGSSRTFMVYRYFPSLSSNCPASRGLFYYCFQISKYFIVLLIIFH